MWHLDALLSRQSRSYWWSRSPLKTRAKLEAEIFVLRQQRLYFNRIYLSNAGQLGAGQTQV